MQPAGLKHILGNPKADRKKSTSQKARHLLGLVFEAKRREDGEKDWNIKLMVYRES